MLTALSIRDVVLIEALDLDFHGGLGVLTGETGAGKSILLDALGLALGARGDSALVRNGAAQAVVTASFESGADSPALALLAESGIEPDPKLVTQVEFELESADAAVARLLRKGVAFDGVVAASDLIALGAIRALRRVGLSVPGDVSVVGYDDMLLSRLSTPALSTIRQDTFRAGQLLVASILEPGAGETPGYLPTELIVRESCGA